MPGFLSEYDDTETLHFGKDGEWWVRVKLHLLRGEFRKAQTLLVKPVMTYVGSTAETKGDVDSVTYQDELVYHAVADWNLTDQDGNLLPLEPEDEKRKSIGRLPEEVFEKVVAVVRTGSVDKTEAKKTDEGAPEDPFRNGRKARAHGERTAAAGAD